ncbi:hypothetical protein CH371_02730 [Leptospira wolffii]|uniref:(2Fe-2S) ferredoxin domain-containing protein n=1 Tax=Leptospira wolffii TaxID=409998 RepID=A0A2M9ZF31_9LEPT|nr:hypothetical protein [Leptospira wolffii]PJZ67013.1 hypothetical protein CH371_02730 [Leptospira wolffii]
MKFRTLFDPQNETEGEALENTEANWEEAILICTKCASKIRGEVSFGKTRLKGEIKAALRSEGIESVRVVEVSCLDVCERDRIAIASSLQSPLGRKILLVPPGTSGRKIWRNLSNLNG